MKNILIISALLAGTLTASAQGANTGMGGNDGDYKSLAEKVLNLETSIILCFRYILIVGVQ